MNAVTPGVSEGQVKGARPQSLLSPETPSWGEGRAPLPTPAKFHHSQFRQERPRASPTDGESEREAGARRRWFFKLRGTDLAWFCLCDCCFA